jgi:hypothetical protein
MSEAENLSTTLPETTFPETSYEQDLEKYTKIDNLDEDKGEENYVLVSFASPEGIMNCTIRALKIRIYRNQSVFTNYEDATNAAKELNKLDKYFPIFVMPTGKWCAWDPDPDDKTKVADQKYPNEKQQQIMDGLTKVEEKQQKNLNDMNALIGKTKDKINTSSEDHKQRIKESITQGIEEKDKPKKEFKPMTKPNTHNSNDLKEKLRARLSEKKKEEKTKLTEKSTSSVVDNLTEQIKETSEVSSKVEENINKAKELLQKMKEKKN